MTAANMRPDSHVMSCDNVPIMRLTHLATMVLGFMLLLVAAPVALADNAVFWTDPSDTPPPAADIGRLGAAYSGETLTVGLWTAYDGSLPSGSRIYILLDTDLDASTGWHGADYQIFDHQTGLGPVTEVHRWDGARFVFAATPLRESTSAVPIGFGVHRSLIGNPTTGVRISLIGDGYAEFHEVTLEYVPDSGTFYFPFVKPSFLTLREATAYSRRAAALAFGRRATSRVARCARQRAAAIRCRIDASNGRFRWAGNATLVEYHAGGRERWSWAFRGLRVDRVCQRRADTRAERRRCVRYGVRLVRRGLAT